jgi:hypothetical protein
MGVSHYNTKKVRPAKNSDKENREFFGVLSLLLIFILFIWGDTEKKTQY